VLSGPEGTGPDRETSVHASVGACQTEVVPTPTARIIPRFARIIIA
jgi:hypothetical protein